ncbi:hypothetical protein CLTEP_11280 [Clostridium tepidiprofundi DSM 19306]|uniref:DUF2179 domain-containing protein n=2 Tax=Clostridium TaxID=1485 RepID=A0A151B4W7_9CLOT|nr:hypothetical protein CLTEP_11280 [Clostridium tepidiprofundi DSM 19306]
MTDYTPKKIIKILDKCRIIKYNIYCFEGMNEKKYSRNFNYEYIHSRRINFTVRGMRSMKKNVDIKKSIKEFAVITFGVALVACALYFFLMPDDIAAGGVNGLSMVINHFIPALPVGSLMLIMNVILFIVGFIVIGVGFGIKTIYASFALSGGIWLLEVICPHNAPMTNDVLLNLILGILIQGVGMGIVFNANASTGGTDILAKILNKYTHIDIGKSLLMIDVSVTLFAGVAFGLSQGLYSLLSVIINGLVIDSAIEGLTAHREVMIVSDKTEIIKDFIINDLNRGATFYYGKGAYRGKDIEILDTIVDKKQFIRLKNYIKETDPTAFVKVQNVHETLGDGFKSILE